MEIPPQLPCNGCGCEIPLDLRGPRRKWCNDCNPKKAPTFVREERHLVPVSAGGDHTRANVALAHNRCNYERNTGGEVQLRLVG